MSDWNDAVYEYYDDKIAQGMTHEQADAAVRAKVADVLGFEPANIMVPIASNKDDAPDDQHIDREGDY